MGRFGKPSEIAKCIIFLISNDSSYITGTNLVADGVDFMVKKNWKIWNNNHKVEERTYARTLKKLPEMEGAKQLQKIIKKDYRKK